MIGLVLVQQELLMQTSLARVFDWLAAAVVALLPAVTLAAGLLMVSNFRYPHLVNKYLRGKRQMGRLVGMLLFALLLVTEHRYTIGVVAVCYAFSAPVWWLWLRARAYRSAPATA